MIISFVQFGEKYKIKDTFPISMTFMVNAYNDM